MRIPGTAAVVACVVLIGVPAVWSVGTGGGGMVAAAQDAPLFEGMGPHTRGVATASAQAQRYFDQGLTWAYAFNHDEAIRSFEEAARLDPECAMAWWGIALCHGPHINNPAMSEEGSRAAWDALRRALSVRENAEPVDRALIEALAARYADPGAGPVPLTPEERAPYDRAYADAMERVYGLYPDDDDVATLYAEALMDLRPWDLWDHRTGEPRPETPGVLEALERALSLNPDHPGANHLYIHAMEASPSPERAVPAADRLRTLVPASGHLVHMPAHIDVRVGRWDLAAEQNRQATRIDARYREISPRQGLYRIYMAHNDHFLSWSCMMLGRSEEAVAAARAMIRKIPPDFVREYAPVVDGYMPIEIDALLRFGRWDELLELDSPPEYLPVTTAIWRFARASAYAAKDEVEAAEREQEHFRRAVRAVPQDALMTLNPAHHVLSIAEHTLAGEIAFRCGEIDEAVSQLRRAVELEDDLRYMEPPDWIQPVRHSLGAILLSAGRTSEAEAVYREDLAKWPENAWSLFGLARSLRAQGSPEADSVEARFKEAWKHADIEMTASCLCVPAGGP